MTSVRLQVLGPMTARVDGRPVNLGGPRQLAVLAMLVCGYPSVVSRDRLVEGVWGGQPPPSVVNTTRAYVSRLRRALEPDRSTSVIAISDLGYALRLPEDAVDAWRFERLLGEASRLSGIDPTRARATAHEALNLWRGSAYYEVTRRPWAAAEAARLENLRLTGWELHIELMIRCGLPHEAVASATSLTNLHPLREHGWQLLAVCLWATGRQVEALTALRHGGRLLAAEVGVAPGSAHVELEQAILAQRIDVLRRWTGQPQVPVRSAR